MEGKEGDTSWLDRVAEAVDRKKSGSLLKSALASIVQRYEDDIAYIKIIKQALDSGRDVSIWEFLDASIAVTPGDHPCANNSLKHVKAFDSREISADQCSALLSDEWGAIVSRKEALENISKELASNANSVEAIAAARSLKIDRTRRLCDWRRFTPGQRL